MIKKSITALALVTVLSGCTMGGPKQTGGTLLGGIGGALAGSQIGKGNGNVAAIAAGTLLGAFIGSSVGESLDHADQMYANQTAQRSLETAKKGQALTWHNPDNGHSGMITPQRTYQTANGQYCREFNQTIQIGGKTQNAYGTACRQPDGTWQIVSNN